MKNDPYLVPPQSTHLSIFVLLLNLLPFDPCVKDYPHSVPEVDLSIVPSRLRKVVLPPPDGPRMITNYPRFIAPSRALPRSVMSCSATTLASPSSSYTFPRPSHSITPPPPFSISRNLSSRRKKSDLLTASTQLYVRDYPRWRRSQAATVASIPCPVAFPAVPSSLTRPPVVFQTAILTIASTPPSNYNIAHSLSWIEPIKY